MRNWLGLIACICSVGCGGAQPTTAASASAQSKIPFSPSMQATFQGHYSSSCHQTYYKGLKLYSTTDEIYILADHSFSKSENLFWDASCQIPFGKGQEKGTYELYDFSVNGSDHNGMNLQFPYGFFDPATNLVSNLLDSKQFCGRADWLMGVWTPTIRQMTNEAYDLGATDVSMKTLIRTECSYASPSECVDITLNRQ